MNRLLSHLAFAAVLAGVPLPGARAAAPASGAAGTHHALMAQIAHQIAAHFQLAGDLEVAPADSYASSHLPTGKAVRVTVTEFTSMPASSMLVRCRLEAGGAPPSSVSLMLRAHLWADAWVAREPLSLGSPFDPSQLDVRRVDLLRQRQAVPASGDPGDYILACSVPAGRVLVWRDLRRRPLVRKGDTIDVSAINGPLTVTVKAVAVQSGGKGETVLVRNLETRKEFSAVVVDDGRAEINF